MHAHVQQTDAKGARPRSSSMQGRSRLKAQAGRILLSLVSRLRVTPLLISPLLISPLLISPLLISHEVLGAEGSAHAAGLEGLLPGTAEGMQGLTVSGGFPWLGMRYQRGLSGGWSPVVELESALLVRSSLAVGVAKTWLERPHFRLGGQVTAGYLFQTGLLAQTGPTLEATVTVAAPFRRLCPLLELSTRHSLLVSSTTLETAEGSSSDVSTEIQWAPRATLGVGIPLGTRLALDAGLDLTWFGPGTVSIPGLHLGLSLGWGGPGHAQGGV